MKPYWTLNRISRCWLLAMFFAVSLLLAWIAWLDYCHTRAEVAQRMESVARAIAAQQEKATESVITLLKTLDQVAHARVDRPGSPTPLFREILANNPQYFNVVFIDTQGIIRDAALEESVGLDVSHRKYFKDAIAQDGIQTGEYVVTQARNAPAFHFSLRVKDPEGRVCGVLAVGINLLQYDNFFAGSDLPKNARYLLLDHKGIRLRRFPPRPESPLGELATPHLVRAVTEDKRDQMNFENTDQIGVVVFYSLIKLHLPGVPVPYMTVVAATPTQSFLSLLPSLAGINLALLATISLLAMLTMHRLMHSQVISPLRQMLEGARRLERGEIWSRIGNLRGVAEIQEVGQAFDEMAISLEQEISNCKMSEAAILAVKNDFELIFENSQVGIMLLRGGRYLFRANQRAADILGYLAPNEMSGRSVRDFHLSEEHFRDFGENYYNRLVDGEKIQIEYQLRRKDGSPIWCSISGKALDPADLDRGVIWAIDDLSSRKTMEVSLISAKEAAEAANRAKAEFLANMSHELRTPLNGVLGMLQLLDDLPLSERQKVLLETALESGRGLLTIVNDILTFAQIEAGRFGIAHEPIAPRAILDSLYRAFRYDAQSRGLKWSVNATPSVPDMVLGDGGRLRQILFNLLSNAFKFTEAGGVSLEVTALPLCAVAGDVQLLFSVQDSGIGIPEDKIEMVFEPFAQVDGSLTRRYQGTGIGLGIVRSLVKRMGGEVEVDSEVGVGTTMYFTVRCGMLQADQVEEQATGLGAGADFVGLVVLLAEDDRVNRFAASSFLERLGCEVAAAENGRRALEMLHEGDYDLVIMDIQMPEMDGIQASQAIRADQSLGTKSRIPILAMTAHAMPGDREQFLAAGMDSYIAKPVDMDELERVLSKLIQSRRSH